MFFRKMKQDIEQLCWKVQSLEDKNKILREDLERALNLLRHQLIRVKRNEEISERMIQEGLAYDSLRGQEVSSFLEKNPDVIFLDVRTLSEFNAGYIPGATHIPIDQIGYRIEELKDFKDQPIVAYCASGNRSEVACEILVEKGFFKVFNLTDGIGAYPDKLEHKISSPSSQISQPSVKRDRPRTQEEDELALKVQKIFTEQINPVVASHGGVIELLDIIDNNVYVRMGGGCQGCSSAALTLKQGVEQTLKSEIPDIGQLYDTTDHASGTNPYYAG